MAEKKGGGLEKHGVYCQLPPLKKEQSLLRSMHHFSGLQTPPPSRFNPPFTRNRINTRMGMGMQAVFLGSSPKSSGTGVFLPRPFINNSNKTPGISPVLLPQHIVEALNVNVQQIGIGLHLKSMSTHQKSSSSDETKEEEGEQGWEMEKKDEIEEIYHLLPEEWTY